MKWREPEEEQVQDPITELIWYKAYSSIGGTGWISG